MTSPTIVLVGPLAAGKTTLGRIVAARLGQPFVDIDDIAWNYGAELGWSLDHLLVLNAQVGWLESERAWEPVRAHAVERAIRDHAGSVIAFGAAYTNYTEPELAGRVRATLAQVDEVVHLLPSSDPAESVAILRQRALDSRGRDWNIEGHDHIAEWVADRHPVEVATATVYTGGISANEAADQIVERLTIPSENPAVQPEHSEHLCTSMPATAAAGVIAGREPVVHGLVRGVARGGGLPPRAVSSAPPGCEPQANWPGW